MMTAKNSSELAMRLLQQLADGDTIPNAAAVMGISYSFARSALSFFYQQIGADNSTHAVAILMRRGELT